MYYIHYQDDTGDNPSTFMITTVDHLFLMPNGKVRPIQYFAPGDKLMNAHGGVSTVRFVMLAKYEGGLHHLFFDGFNNETLGGHLLSANGVVCADYSVQLKYSSGELNPSLVDLPDDGTSLLRVGDAEYKAKHVSAEAISFLNDKKQWPAGMTPLVPREMINVPLGAASFFTKLQAEDIQKIVDMTRENGVNVSTAKWLFNLFDGLKIGKIIYLVDWENDLPNGYAWESAEQQFLLLTGGLLRISSFNRAGISFVVAHLVSHIQGVKCVGPADYQAVSLYTRLAWNGDLFFSAYREGLAQVKSLFNAVSDKNAKADPNDICGQPSLKCREAIYEAAGAFNEMPACGDPNDYFGVIDAVAGQNLRRVKVNFNRLVNPQTGATLKNYSIIDTEGNNVQIKEAKISYNPAAVKLAVEELKPRRQYTVIVENVLSENDQPISPEHNQTDFLTRK